ncbi:hypothetical protein GWI34_07015 [Actinomadura sp. DSM 109109]|nr:hypothetical protein [Actinomadura lepetitiana]
MTLPQFDISPKFLRVTDPRVPHIGETVMLVEAANVPSARQVPWFKSSTGVLFGPCTDPQRAAEAIHFLLIPWVGMALKKRANAYRPFR